MTAKTITSRDGQWTLTMCGESWVSTVTHNPSGRSMRGGASIAAIRKRAASGELLAELDRDGESAPAATTWKRKPPTCEADVTPCGAEALLYPCGWRCDAHSPAAVRMARQATS